VLSSPEKPGTDDEHNPERDDHAAINERSRNAMKPEMGNGRKCDCSDKGTKPNAYEFPGMSVVHCRH
jgi:hypothetical protein